MMKRRVIKLLSLWPPLLGAGVRVNLPDPDYRTVDVSMKLRFWNRNYVGTHFGGSIYSMCDPFFMLILIENLGREYIVWDKSAAIRFKKPGTGTLRARFHISEEQIEEIRQAAKSTYKVEPTFTVQIKNDQDEVVAEIDKVLHVRRKDAKRLE